MSAFVHGNTWGRGEGGAEERGRGCVSLLRYSEGSLRICRKALLQLSFLRTGGLLYTLFKKFNVRTRDFI